MKAHWTYAAVLSLAVAGAGITALSLADEPRPTGTENLRSGMDKAQDTANQAAKDVADTGRRDVNTTVDEKTASDIRSRLASTINSEASRDSFDKLVGNFVKADRDRIGQDRYRDFSRLNDKIDEFRKAYRDKYNQEFDLKNAELEPLAIYRGPDKDSAWASLQGLMMMRDHRGAMIEKRNINEPYAVTGETRVINREEPAAVVVGQPRTDDKHPSQVIVKVRDPDGTYRETEMNASAVHNPDIELRTNPNGTPGLVAVDRSDDAHVQWLRENRPWALHGTETTVTPSGTVEPHHETTVEPRRGDMGMGQRIILHNEGVVGNGWRIDIPDTLGARGLSDSLIRHLQMVIDNRANWPTDIHEADRMISQHLLTALYDTGTNLGSER